ncbi:hypothetical protein OL548_30815 [Lysinibacillus sp. MHQ-1]|nr:hypothetical protein OL548_30815 [Lysinibacillus sp. MHQ-1]
MQHLHDIALKVLKDHLNVQSSETLLILTDVQKQDLATIFYKAGLTITANTMFMVMPLLEKIRAGAYSSSFIAYGKC